MSTATPVPETAELTGDDARQTLRDTGTGHLVKEAFVRLRYADGFSHSRSLAFLMSLVLVQGIIAIVGLASALGDRDLARGIVTAIRDVAPGPCRPPSDLRGLPGQGQRRARARCWPSCSVSPARWSPERRPWVSSSGG